MHIRSKATVRGIAAVAFSGALVAGAAGMASADSPPLVMNGYQWAGTYSSTAACEDEGDYLESWAAATDYFCYTSGSDVWLYIDPGADD
jgi:hypothetical protein